jgi:hypothetical protein
LTQRLITKICPRQVLGALDFGWAPLGFAFNPRNAIAIANRRLLRRTFAATGCYVGRRIALEDTARPPSRLRIRVEQAIRIANK